MWWFTRGVVFSHDHTDMTVLLIYAIERSIFPKIMSITVCVLSSHVQENNDCHCNLHLY